MSQIDDVVDVTTEIGVLRGKIVERTEHCVEPLFAVRLLPGQFARGTLLAIREDEMTLAPSSRRARPSR